MHKINFVLTCTMEKDDMKSGDIITDNAPFVSKTETVLAGTDVNVLYKNATDKCIKSMANFQRRGSGWRFKSVVKLDVNTVLYKPLKGSSYIPLPPVLAKREAIINMKNKDDQCFKWFIARALNPVVKNQERISKILRKQADELNWNKIIFPVKWHDIDIFERHNKGIAVNVFGYEEHVYPLRISNIHTCDEKIVDLLLISNDTTNHYCLVKNLSRLLTAQNGGRNTLHYCRRCLLGYREIKSLNKHKEFCNQHDAVKIDLPAPGTILKFNSYTKSMRVPFIVYADCESFNKPIDTCPPNPDKSYTNKYQKHSPSSFCYYIKCFDDNVYKQDPVAFTAQNKNDDVAQIFVNSLVDNIKQI